MKQQINIRQAINADIKEVARIFRAIRNSDLPYLQNLHTPQEDLEYFTVNVFKEDEIWVAVEGNNIIGFCAFKKDWLDHLYVLNAHQGKGVGAALLNKAKEKFHYLQLWVFQRNENAKKFYEANGFLLKETTNGSTNEEKEPDALYVWYK